MYPYPGHKTAFITLAVVLLLLLFLLYVDNKRINVGAGTARVELPEGQKLIAVAWQGMNMWYLTRARRDDEPIESYTFREDSKSKSVVYFSER